MVEWLSDNEALAWWMAAISAITFVATLIAVPIIVVRLPADYFVTDEHRKLIAFRRHPLLQLLWQSGKTLLGIALLVMGVLMLVLPGQGIITMLIGIMLLEFPRKHEVERWIVSRRRVLRSINWLRRRYKRPSLQLPDSETRP